MSESTSVEKSIGHLFRHEAGRMAAVLTRLLGTKHLDDVDDIVQDTLLKALEVWKVKGLPQNPSAWLFTVARNKAIDFLRQRKKSVMLEAEHLNQLDAESEAINFDKNIDDAVLRMMFACCHPVIPVESQIAFTLKTLGGLSVAEIANAFLTSEETIAKRIYRAKEKIREEKVNLEPPPLYELRSRLDSVCKVLYLLFNEGYYSSNPHYTIREDLCAEAMRLTYLLLNHSQTSLPLVKALFALMCLQASRFPARADDQNQIVLLEFQDRAKWNQELMQRGFYWLEQASVGNELSEYHVEAAIASVHASVPDFRQTNWQALLGLYEALYTMKPSPATALNRAITIGYARSPQAGIDVLLAMPQQADNHYYDVALGEFYNRLNQNTEAKLYLQKALNVAQAAAERVLIQEKLNRLGSA